MEGTLQEETAAHALRFSHCPEGSLSEQERTSCGWLCVAGATLLSVLCTVLQPSIVHEEKSFSALVLVGIVFLVLRVVWCRSKNLDFPCTPVLSVLSLWLAHFFQLFLSHSLNSFICSLLTLFSATGSFTRRCPPKCFYLCESFLSELIPYI